MLSNSCLLAVYLLTGLLAISQCHVDYENSETVYLLRLQWPPGDCIAMGDRCRGDLVQDSYWTIHGLWRKDDCETSHDFDYSLLTESSRDELNTVWTNIKSGETNEEFWKREYEKHGCAVNWDQVEYFRQSLELYKGYRPAPQLSQAGVTPGGSYSIEKFKSAFDENVKLKCNDDNSVSELEFCFDEGYNVIGCDEWEDSCSDNLIYSQKQQQQQQQQEANRNLKLRVVW